MSANRAISFFRGKLRYIQLLRPRNIAIVGSINTNNTGDNAIVMSLFEFLEAEYKITAHLYGWDNKLIKGYKNILVCGGDILHDRKSSNLSKIEKLVFNNNSVSFIGVGCPGYYGMNSSNHISLLRKSNQLIVRDSLSYDRLKKFGFQNLIQSFDNAFCFNVNHDLLNPSKKSKHHIIGASIKSYSSSTLSNPRWTAEKFKVEEREGYETLSLNEYVNRYHEVLGILRKQGNRVRIISMTKEDEVFAKKYFSDYEIVDYKKDPKKLLKEISEMDKMFCTRYHSFIFSLLLRKPLTGYAYSDKIDALCSHFGMNEVINRYTWNDRDEVLSEFHFNNDYTETLIETIEFSRNIFKTLIKGLNEN